MKYYSDSHIRLVESNAQLKNNPNLFNKSVIKHGCKKALTKMIL